MKVFIYLLQFNFFSKISASSGMFFFILQHLCKLMILKFQNYVAQFTYAPFIQILTPSYKINLEKIMSYTLNFLEIVFEILWCISFFEYFFSDQCLFHLLIIISFYRLLFLLKLIVILLVIILLLLVMIWIILILS